MATDIILLILTLFFIWNGANQGLLRSLMGPLAFCAAGAVAWIYYGSTKNLMVSLGIAFFGPLILQMVFSSFLPAENGPPPLIGSILGAILNTAWGLAIILPVILALAIMPPVVPWLGPIQKDVKLSLSFTTMKRYALEHHLPIPGLEPAPASAATAGSGNSVEDLAQDQRMQDLLNDPAIVKAIEHNDYAALMGNPKILAIARDPAFVQKIFAAYGQIQQQQPAAATAPAK